MKASMIALAAAAALAALLGGRSLIDHPNQETTIHAEPGTLLFDYYDGQAGLPMEPGYDEYTLTATEDPDKLLLDVYYRPTGDGQVETKTSYLVSSQALEDAMALVRRYKMADWNEREYPSITGRKYVCKFQQGDKFIRVSSECMPENGKEVFKEIYLALAAYIDPALKLESPDGQTGRTATLRVLHTLSDTMSIPRDGAAAEPETSPEPQIVTVQAGSGFMGFTVTEVEEDHVTFVSDLARYIVNDGPIETEFTVRKGEKLSLRMADILDATDTTWVELLDVTEPGPSPSAQ